MCVNFLQLIILHQKPGLIGLMVNTKYFYLKNEKRKKSVVYLNYNLSFSVVLSFDIKELSARNLIKAGIFHIGY